MTTTQHIDEQIARVRRVPTSFRRAVAPVLRLPSEILVYIFLHYARRNFHEIDTGVPQWVSVTRVCSYWRCIALYCPALWSYLFIASPRWTDELLIRSKKVPLWVHIYFTPVNRRAALKFLSQVTPHAERFRECRLNILCEDANAVLSMLALRSVPLLRTLAITLKHLPYCWNLMDMEADVDVDIEEDTQLIAPDASNGDTPALHELQLINRFMTWFSPTLTVLRLQSLHYSAQPTMATLKVILTRMPGLVQLYLDNAIRGSRHDPVQLEAEKIHLPKLTHLLVVAPFSRVVRFLSCINIPMTTRVRLGCRLITNADRNDYGPFLAFVSQRFSNFGNESTPFAPIRTLVMDNAPRYTAIIFSRSERKCNCRGSVNNWQLLFRDCDCDIPLEIHVKTSPHTEYGNSLLVGICASVPLTRLENLVATSRYFPLVPWFDILWYLPGLRFIEFIGGNLSDIILLLSLSPRPLPRNPDGPTNRRTTEPFAPLLKELRLVGVWAPRNLRCGGKPKTHQSHATLFRDALASRKAAGCALEQLLIKGNLAFGQDKVTLLKEVVPQIEVHSFGRFQPDNGDCEDCGGVGREAAEELGADELSDDDWFERVGSL